MNRVEIGRDFQDLIDRTREFLEGQEEDPILAVDLSEILPDFWDEWFNPLLEAWTQQARSDLCEFFLKQMELHPGDVAVRYSALAVYDGLIRYLTAPLKKKLLPKPPSRSEYIQETPPSFQENVSLSGTIVIKGPIEIEIPSWKRYVALLQEDLRSVLHFVQIRDISEWRNIRWEISNSCLVEDWDRAFRLYDRAREVGVVDERDLRLLLGQFQFSLAFCDTPDTPVQADMVRDNHTLLRKQDRLLHPANWEPQLYDSPNLLESWLLLASGLVASSAGSEASGPDRIMLRDATEDLERARELGPLPAPYGAALARCYFAADRYHEAAAQYQCLLEQDLAGQWALLTAHVYRAVASSYVAAEEPKKAIRALQECSSRFPAEADIYLRIAELQSRQTDYVAVTETIRNASDNLPGFDEDWRYSSLLALGEIHPGPGLILSAEMVPPEPHDILVALLRDYWPTFEKLSNKAKEQWIAGTYFLLPTESRISEAVSLNARLSFIRALEIELKRSVFDSVREYFSENAELRKLIETQLEDAKNDQQDRDLTLFCRFVANHWRFTIGLGSTVLLLCQSPKAPISAAIREWLDRTFPRLLPLATLLDEVRRFRNAAEHEGISPRGWEEVPKACRTLIESFL